MPLLGKDPHELGKTKGKPGREYFVIRFTNEHFKTYSEYIECLEKYRRRQWTCSITNKHNLTYEEALLSEKKAFEKVAKFSDILLPHCLELIQYKESNLDDLRDYVYDYFNENYFPGEMITFKAEGTKYTGKVVETESSENEDKDKTKESNGKKSNGTNSKFSDSEGENETSTSTTTTTTANTSDSSTKDTQEKNYIVQIEPKNKKLTVPLKDIIRRIPPIYKPMIKDTIKLVSKKTKQGYWLLDESVEAKYDIRVPVPSHLKNEISLKRKADELSKDGDDSSEEETKRHRARSKYPMEDTEIDRTNDEEKPVRPVPSCNFICPNNMYGDILMIWHFVHQFEKVLQLTPFTMEEFEQALQNAQDSTLLLQTHLRLMKIVFELPIYHSVTKKTFNSKMLNERNWLSTMKVYFAQEITRLEAEEKKKADRKKQLEEENNKMIFLATEVEEEEEEDQAANAQKDEQDKKNEDTEMTDKKDGEEEEEAEGEEEEEVGDDEEEDEDAEDNDEDYVDEDLFINSRNPDQISKVLKKRHYNRLDVEERIHILSYLVIQAISSDKIRKYVDEISGLAGEIRQEKRGLVLEERKIKKEEEQQQEAKKQNTGKKNGKESELDKIQKKEENLDQQLNKYSTRLEWLGSDREYNKYWYWTQLPGRIYIELSNGDWSYYNSRQELEDLIKYLDNRGIRERKLLTAIKQKYDSITAGIEALTNKLNTQLNYENKRSARLKALYGDRNQGYQGYVNKYKFE